MAADDRICGVTDSSISPVLRAWIKQGNRMVCGVIGPGSSRTLSAKWDSPLESTNVGSQGSVQRIGDLLQAGTGATSITTFSTTQIWQGNMPLKFALNLVFIAQSDAYGEVMQPLQWLEEFASGNVKGVIPIDLISKAKSFYSGSGSDKSFVGRIPYSVCVNIGRKIIVPNCVIENISIPLDKERTAAGDLVRAEVQLDIQTMTMQNRDDIAGTWNGSSKVWAKTQSSDWDDGLTK